MTAQENKAAFRSIPEEVINNGDLDLADEVFASDYIEHQPGAAEHTRRPHRHRRSDKHA